MVSILRFFHYGQASSSRKLPSPARHHDGLYQVSTSFEEPRNSLEFPTETSRSNQIFEDDIPYSCEVQYHSMKVNSHSNEAPISTIDEVVSKKSKDRYNRPSVVAQLMGVDTLSSEINSITHPQKSKRDEVTIKGSTRATSVTGTSYASKSTMPRKKEILHYARHSEKHITSVKSEKPKMREHPQEEELQKFKKEFEAWEASRMWESSRLLDLRQELGNSIEKKKHVISFEHEKLSKEKEYRYREEERNSLVKRTTDDRYCSSTTRPTIATDNGDTPKHKGLLSNQTKSITIDDLAFEESTKCKVSLLSTRDQQNISTMFRKVVILKPFSEISDDAAIFLSSSPEIIQKENMHDFLEQVRKKLEIEMQGKATDRFIESAKDYKNTLAWSELSRSRRCEVQLNGKKSPQLLSEDTRNLLSERLKNILRRESYTKFPLTANGRQSSSSLNSDPETFKPTHYLDDNNNKVSFWEDIKFISPELKSSQHDHRHSVIFDDEVSPRNLVRSFSAPVSGTAFGKLLVEDKHVMKTVHVRKRQEASEDASADVRNTRKDSFNIKSKVSSIRLNFALKGKFFGKKAQLMNEKDTLREEVPYMSDTFCVPSVVLSTGFAQENLTEVPPSPVSECSSSDGDICRPSYPSPVSPFEATFADDHSSSQVSGELGAILPEPGQPEPPESDELDEEIDKADSVHEVITDEEDDAKACVRDILTVSDLLEKQSLDQPLLGWDSLSKASFKWVFDRVEESYEKTREVDNPTILLSHDCVEISRRMLIDLLNEALLKFVQIQMVRSTIRSDRKRLQFNKELFDNLWNQIQALTKPLEENSHSLESIVAWDLHRISWPSAYENYTDAVGMEMEMLILRDLINELVHDLFPSSDGVMR